MIRTFERNVWFVPLYTSRESCLNGSNIQARVKYAFTYQNLLYAKEFLNRLFPMLCHCERHRQTVGVLPQQNKYNFHILIHDGFGKSFVVLNSFFVLLFCSALTVVRISSYHHTTKSHHLVLCRVFWHFNFLVVVASRYYKEEEDMMVCRFFFKFIHSSFFLLLIH